MRTLAPILTPLLFVLWTAPAAALLQVERTLGSARHVSCLVADRGTLWVGTRGAGLFRLAGEGATPERLDAAAGLPGNRVNDCAADMGELGGLWVATEAGVVRVGPRGGLTSVLPGRALKIGTARASVLVAMADGTLWKLSNGTRSVSHSEVVPMAMAVAADGRWAVGGFGRIQLSAPGGLESLPPEVADAVVEQMGFQDGVLWLQAAGRRFRRDVSVRHGWRAVAAPPAQPAELGSRRLTARALLGPAAVLGTDDGIFIQHPGAPPVVQPLSPMPCGDRVAALAVVADTLWVGSFDTGLCRLQQGRWSHFRGPRHLPSDMVNDLASDGVRLYVATTRGLTIVHPDGRFEQLTHEQCRGKPRGRCPWHAAVTGVSRDASTGHVWVADAGALHRIDPRSGRWTHYYRRAGVGSSRITRVAAGHGQAAAGSVDRGLFLTQGRRFRNLDDQAGLSDNWVTDLAYAADGSLWVATCTRGITQLAADGTLRRLAMADGLVDDYALAVRPIGERIFVGSLSGLSVLGRAGAIQNLSSRHGLSGDEVHDVVRFQDRFWVATDGGLSVLREVP